MSQSEKLCLGCASLVFSTEFIETKDILSNPETGTGFLLDAYSPDLGIAFIHSKPWHHVYVQEYNETVDSLYEQMYRDNLKMLEAIKKHIFLVFIPCTISNYEDMMNFMKGQKYSYGKITTKKGVVQEKEEVIQEKKEVQVFGQTKKEVAQVFGQSNVVTSFIGTVLDIFTPQPVPKVNGIDDKTLAKMMADGNEYTLDIVGFIYSKLKVSPDTVMFANKVYRGYCSWTTIRHVPTNISFYKELDRILLMSDTRKNIQTVYVYKESQRFKGNDKYISGYELI